MRYFLISILILLLSGCQTTNKNTLSNEVAVAKENHKINSMEDLNTFIKDGQKNGYFPTKILASSFIGTAKLQTVDLNFRKTIQWDIHSKCPSHEDEIILALDSQDHSIVCSSGDTVVIANGGNDFIDNAVGNDIFYPGGGNDTIETSYGSDIFIFEENWGHDTLKLSSRDVDTNRILGYDGSYPWKYTSFIIFGKNISRSDMQWQGNTLVNTKTGDSITINTKSINILFADETSMTNIDQNYIASKQELQKIKLENMRAESVLIKGNYAFFAKGDEGLQIVNVEDLLNPVIVSTVVLPGRAMSIHVEDGVAYVAQGDVGLEGKRGWVSIIDVKNPRQPKIIKNLTFGNSIFSLAVHDHILYVPDTHFFNQDERTLQIFDVSKPRTPMLVSQTKLNHYSKFITYLNDAVYLSNFQSGLSAFEVSDPARPRQTDHHKHVKKSVWSIKTAQNRLVVNHADNILGIYKASKSHKIIPVCDIYSTDQNSVAGLAGIDAIAVRDNIVFRAEGKMGVSINDTDSCKTIALIPFPDYWVSSVYIIQNTLVAFGDRRESRLYNLDKLFPKYATTKQITIAKKSTRKENKAEQFIGISQDRLQTMLYQAAQNSKGEKVTKLCKAGAMPNLSGHERQTPMQISARLGSLKALEALLENGGKPDGKSMMLAALREQIDAMKLLEKYGGNIAQTDKDGCTTLHYIAQDGTVEMVQYLVEKNVPVNATCRGKETALKWAQYGKNMEVIHYLKGIGAKP